MITYTVTAAVLVAVLMTLLQSYGYSSGVVCPFKRKSLCTFHFIGATQPFQISFGRSEVVRHICSGLLYRAHQNGIAEVRDWWSLLEPEKGKGQGAFFRFEQMKTHRDVLFTKAPGIPADEKAIGFWSKEYMSTTEYTYHGVFTDDKMIKARMHSEMRNQERDYDNEKKRYTIPKVGSKLLPLEVWEKQGNKYKLARPMPDREAPGGPHRFADSTGSNSRQRPWPPEDDVTRLLQPVPRKEICAKRLTAAKAALRTMEKQYKDIDATATSMPSLVDAKELVRRW